MSHWAVYHKGKAETIELEERPDDAAWERVMGPYGSKVEAETAIQKEESLWKPNPELMKDVA